MLSRGTKANVGEGRELEIHELDIEDHEATGPRGANANA